MNQTMNRTLSPALLQLQRQIYRETQSGARPVKQLLPWLLDRRNLDAAWARVSSADGARTPGPDGLVARDVAGRVDGWLTQLAGQLIRGRFQPAPPRLVDVPKGPHTTETRRLGVLNLADRVVHAALKQVLEPILEPGFDRDSFGFRPGRSVPGALAAAARLLSDLPDGRRPFTYVCKADIARCFDTIDHALLLGRLAAVLGDEAALGLLGQLLAVGGTMAGWLRHRAVGLVQGSGLSPLLCNFYLDPLDQAVAELGRRSGGGVRLLRYADDLLLLAADAPLARRSQAVVRSTLGRLRQGLKSAKTVVAPAERGVRWLGVELRPRDEHWSARREFVYYVPDDKVTAMLARLDEMTEPPSTRIDPAAFDLGRWLGSINEQLRDWWQAYVFAENGPAVFRRVDEHAAERVGALLGAVTGARRRLVAADYRINLPRGFQTWQVNGTQLCVLSSLAPRRAAYLVHKPLWMKPPARRQVPLAAGPGAGRQAR